MTPVPRSPAFSGGPQLQLHGSFRTGMTLRQKAEEPSEVLGNSVKRNKEEKTVNRRHLVVAVLALGAIALLPVKGFAAFASVKRTTSPAEANLTGAGSIQMDILLKRISDNSTTTQVFWTGVTLPASWVRSGAYLQLNSTITVAGGGIQVYTDNKAADASPQFTLRSGVTVGSPGSNPAGLVDTTTTTKRLSMAWSIKDTTSAAPTADNPNSGGADSFQWLFMKDRQTPTIVLENTTAFTNGEAFVTVKRIVDDGESGIHFGQAPTEFGAAPSPDFVYFQADFNTAVTPRRYFTSTLRLEAYTQ